MFLLILSDVLSLILPGCTVHLIINLHDSDDLDKYKTICLDRFHLLDLDKLFLDSPVDYLNSTGFCIDIFITVDQEKYFSVFGF